MSRIPIYAERMSMHTMWLPKGLYAKVQTEAVRESLEQGRNITAAHLIRRELEALVRFR